MSNGSRNEPPANGHGAIEPASLVVTGGPVRIDSVAIPTLGDFALVLLALEISVLGLRRHMAHRSLLLAALRRVDDCVEPNLAFLAAAKMKNVSGSCQRSRRPTVFLGTPVGVAFATAPADIDDTHPENSMRSALASLVAAGSIVAAGAVYAAAPASAPAGSTGMCKDGTYTTNETKKGACSGHKGVKDWYAATAAEAPAKNAAAAPTAKTATPAAAPAAAAAAAPAPAAAKATPASTKTAAAPTSNAAPAPGGGAGQVWVNTSSKVYHCPGTKYYGKTKQGEYMSESAAKAAGAHADHGKACS